MSPLLRPPWQPLLSSTAARLVSCFLPEKPPRPLGNPSDQSSRRIPGPRTGASTPDSLGCRAGSVAPPDPEYWRLYERSEEHTSELQSLAYLVCRLLLEKKKTH